ncbi:MAG: hypothetical protein P8J86_06085 [Phycisphaerales bacterium]|nr:hypothetical protein [Phycisphaerales bacterium]
MPEKQSSELEMTADQIAFLEEVISKYGLPDQGKAIRCLINFARDRTDLADAIFAEMRCLDCGS